MESGVNSSFCNSAQSWLLDAELPSRLGGDAPTEVAAHVQRCEECRRFAARLERIERTYRKSPVASTATTLEAFQRRLAEDPVLAGSGKIARIDPVYVVSKPN